MSNSLIVAAAGQASIAFEAFEQAAVALLPMLEAKECDLFVEVDCFKWFFFQYISILLINRKGIIFVFHSDYIFFFCATKILLRYGGIEQKHRHRIGMVHVNWEKNEQKYFESSRKWENYYGRASNHIIFEIKSSLIRKRHAIEKRNKKRSPSECLCAYKGCLK